MLSLVFFLFSFAQAKTCSVHAVLALGKPSLLANVKPKAATSNISDGVAVLSKEFGLTLASLCSGKPCGMDAKVDQVSRDQANLWIRKAESLKEEDQRALKGLIRDWLRVEIRYLEKTSAGPKDLELRKSKLRFFDARFWERKSPYKDLLCLD